MHLQNLDIVIRDAIKQEIAAYTHSPLFEERIKLMIDVHQGMSSLNPLFKAAVILVMNEEINRRIADAQAIKETKAKEDYDSPLADND